MERTNDSDGQAFAAAAAATGFPAFIKTLNGYSVTLSGLDPDGTTDFTSQISLQEQQFRHFDGGSDSARFHYFLSAGSTTGDLEEMK